MKFAKSDTAPLEISDTLDGWYTHEAFWDILKKEQNRSDRTGVPFSYVQIKLAKDAVEKNDISNQDLKRFIQSFTGIISQNIRNFDYAFFIDPFTFGILLIDTSPDGAKGFIEKISKKINGSFKSGRENRHFEIFSSVSITSHPSNQIPFQNNSKMSPIVTNSDGFRREKNAAGHNCKLHISEPGFHVNGNSFSLSNDVIVLGYPYLWDLVHKQRNKAENFYRFWKRIMDIVGSIVAIILFSPIILLICLIIKLTSKGPVLFKQTRIGHLHKPITFLKFRTMKHNSDHQIHQEYVKKLIEGTDESLNQGSEEKPIYKLHNDPRVTRIGHCLRKTSLDEIPQLFNVLKGELSLVGPRPPIDYEIEKYKNWHLRRVLEVKPGITGLWQVYGRSKTTFDEMVRLDLQYAEKKSILQDMKILLYTFGAIINTEKAQ